MKKIILGISVLLMFVQNGFATTDTEYDGYIANSSGYHKQNLKCEKMAGNYMKTSSAKECVKAVQMLESLPDSNPDKFKYLESITLNAGQLFFFSEDNKIKACKYWFKAAELGSKSAQKNLNLMYKKYPWACK